MLKIGIIGAGIAGLTTAIALKRIGIDALIFEAAPEIRTAGAGLALAANAIQGFTRLGIDSAIIKAGKEINTFSLLNEKGKILTSTNNTLLKQRYGLNNFTIHRAELHRVLLSFIDGKQLVLNKRSSHLEQTSDHVVVWFQDGSKEVFDYLIVADGIHSPLRTQLIPGSEPRYSGYTCWRAVIDYPALQTDRATETWGSKGRFGIVPLAANKVYWFACVNAPFNSSHMKAFKVRDLQNQFQNYHQLIRDLLNNTRDEDLIWNDIIDLVPVNQYAFDRVVLIGDAAHATTPNMGQGACQAIEDAVILGQEMSLHPDPVKAFAAFEKRRLPRTHWIVNNSFKIGTLAQLENPFLVALRNSMFRIIPKSVNEKRLQKLYQVNF